MMKTLTDAAKYADKHAFVLKLRVEGVEITARYGQFFCRQWVCYTDLDAGAVNPLVQKMSAMLEEMTSNPRPVRIAYA